MFGIGGPGGMAGSSSKQARFNSRELSGTVRVDSFGSFRTTVDAQQGFERFAVRFNGLYQNTKTWQDMTSSEQKAFTITGTFKISSKTQLRAQFERSKNAGTVVYPFPTRWRWASPIGFVANFSENFQGVPTGNALYTGERPDTPFSKTLDFGLRYSVPNGVAYATLTHYKTDQVGQLGNFGSTGDISNIWLNLGYTDPALTTFGPFRDTSDRTLEGWEFEITANPTRNITFQANYSHPTVRTVADSIGRREYVAAHLAEWQAGAAARPGQVINGRAILDPAVIAMALQNIDNSFNGSTAGTIGNGPRHRASFNGSYRFTEGRMRGLGLVLGVTYRSHNKAGSRDAQLKYNTTTPTLLQTTQAAWDYLWTPPVWTTTAGANYTRRIAGRQFRFQLNVTNLLNDDDPQWNSYSVINAGQLTPALAAGAAGRNPRMQVLSGFVNPEPRKFLLTTTVTF